MRPLTGITAAAAGCAALLLTLALPAGASTGNDEPRTGGHVSGDIHLDGEQEVPGPGDADGRGMFRYVIKNDRLCYSLTAHKIAKPTAAHIHIAPRGEAGPVVVTLKTPVKGMSRDCIQAQHRQNPDNAATVLTRQELHGIVDDPWAHYANVHNKPFPAGAIRGQLEHRS